MVGNHTASFSMSEAMSSRINYITHTCICQYTRAIFCNVIFCVIFCNVIYVFSSQFVTVQMTHACLFGYAFFSYGTPVFFIPHPPTCFRMKRASPAGKGENHYILLQGAVSPCIPVLLSRRPLQRRCDRNRFANVRAGACCPANIFAATAFQQRSVLVT